MGTVRTLLAYAALWAAVSWLATITILPTKHLASQRTFTLRTSK